MKNLLCIFLSLAVTFLFSGLAFATDNQSNAEGKITLTDAGDGPGCSDIGLSAGSFVAYSGATTAGGYGTTNAGEAMCCTTASSKAERKVANIFGVRSNQMANAVDDNNVYQFHKDNDELIVLNDVVTEADKDISGWHIRGGS